MTRLLRNLTFVALVWVGSSAPTSVQASYCEGAPEPQAFCDMAGGWLCLYNLPCPGGTFCVDVENCSCDSPEHEIGCTCDYWCRLT